MDICTTPPPNVDEQLKLEQSENQKPNCENGKAILQTISRSFD